MATVSSLDRPGLLVGRSARIQSGDERGRRRGELLERMKEAVEYGHITPLERLIGEIERLESAYPPLAGQFKRLLLKLDMDRVQKRARRVQGTLVSLCNGAAGL